MRLDLPGAEVDFIPDADIGVSARDAFDALAASIPWKRREISIHGRRIMQPRMTSWHGDEGAIYTYSGRTHVPKPWTPTLAKIRAAVEVATGARFNSVLLNLYPNERASIGMHSDDEPELGERPTIASVSLGATRTFTFKPKRGGRSVQVPLSHGSLLVMRGDTQKNWLHGISKTTKPCGERINLTFRWTEPTAR